MIFKLSDITLTKDEEDLLNKGLTFCPAFKFIQDKAITDIKEFERKAQLPYNFATMDSHGGKKRDRQISRFGYRKTDYEPKYTCPEVKKARKDIESNIQKLTGSNKRYYNLTKGQYEAIKTLQDKDIIIKPCDKGAGICVMTPEDYERKCYNLLNDKKDYKRISHDLTNHIFSLASSIVSDICAAGGINETEYDALMDYQPRLPNFYGLPKIHKKDQPMRPIISQIQGPTYHLNRICDILLKETENRIPELIKDTREFLVKIHEMKIPENSLLVTLDIRSLYTNIPWEEGTDIVCTEYQKTHPIHPPIPTQLLHKAIMFIMENNIFHFNNEIFQQLFGTAMGANVAVRYANIFTSVTWHRMINDEKKPFFFTRLIDDIFMIWTSTEQELNKFVNNLNTKHESIKFDHNFSKSEISFLDTVVYVENNILYTKPYTKPTDRQAYLDFTSSHPTHLKKSLPYSQALRIRRNTSNNNTLKTELEKLQTVFATRKYPTEFTSKEIKKVWKFSQKDLLIKKVKKNTYRIPLVIDYSQELDQLPKLAQQAWNKHVRAHATVNWIYKDPMVTAFRRTKNLAALLTRSKYTRKKEDKANPKRNNMELMKTNSNRETDPILTNDEID